MGYRRPSPLPLDDGKHQEAVIYSKTDRMVVVPIGTPCDRAGVRLGPSEGGAALPLRPALSLFSWPFFVAGIVEVNISFMQIGDWMMAYAIVGLRGPRSGDSDGQHAHRGT